MRGENRLGGMFTPKLGLLVSSTPQAEEAAQALRAMQEFVPILESDAVVVLVPHGDFDLEAIVTAAPWVLDCTSAAPAAANVERL